MPPLALHTVLAKQTADRLALSDLDEGRGELYLGATAPDIRVITRWDRSRTHFFDLDEFEEQSGVSGLFAAHPALAEAGNLSRATRAFIAGYITHLVMDEMWIGSIYRPWFGHKSPLGGSLRANIMDRALQFSLDADSRGDRELMLHVLNEVAHSDLQLEVDFIDSETLGNWRNVITDYVDREPDWERFRERAGRHLKEAGFEGDEGCAELAMSLPEVVDETLRYLTAERVDEWMRESVAASERALREYLR